MKKILLLLTFIAGNLFTVNAQVCTPSWSGGGDGLRPDSAQNLPTGTVGIPYSATIQVKVPADSIYLGQKVAIDSIVLTSFTGFPSTLSYACNPSNCSFPGNSIGCVEISGTPVIADIGVHHLKGHVLTWISNGQIAIPDSATYYEITVNSSSGINTIDRYNFDAGQNYPNPVENTTQIDFNLPVSGTIYFKVYNLLGSVLYEQNYYAKAGTSQVTFDAGNLPGGMYFYTLSDGTNTVTHRMIVDNR